MRSVRAGIALVISALVLSGCAVFSGTPTAAQKQTMGSVAVQFSVCASDTGSSPPAGSCDDAGNSADSAESDPAQLWVGFRVPTGTTAPTSFRSSSTGPTNTGPQLKFTSSSAYTSELQRLEPAAKGQTWVGYVSQYVTYSDSSGAQNFTATVDFGLPRHASGAPFAGPFKYQLVVGGREYDRGSSSTSPAVPAGTEPIDCGTSATVGNGTIENGGEDTAGVFESICIDDSSPSSLGANATLATRDAGIVAGARATVGAGATAHASFKFEYAGAAPGASFKLTATTTVRRTSATPSVAKITPSGNLTKRVVVSLKVPASTKPGTYEVKLKAKLPDGESRTATDTVRVR